MIGMSFVCLMLLPTACCEPPSDGLRLSTPAVVAELDTGPLKGEPWRLAWSPDGTEVYIATREATTGRDERLRHFLIASTGGRPRSINQMPDWAATYWAWKAAQASPASPAFRISVDERREFVRAVSAPRGGTLAGMGGDTSAGGAVAGGGGPVGPAGSVVLPDGQSALVRTMRLQGEVIGEWVNAGIVPGLTFGWSPAGMELIAFSSPRDDNRVVVMDREGRKQTIEGSKDTSLPAWSDDGARLAYLQRKDRRKYTLYVVEVSRPDP
jgi:hypothetical protein